MLMNKKLVNIFLAKFEEQLKCLEKSKLIESNHCIIISYDNDQMIF